MSEQPDDGQHTGIAPYSYLLMTMALFGTGFTSSKVVVGEIPHDVAAPLRFGGGAVILIFLLCLRPGSARFSWRGLWRAGMVGLIGVFAYNFFFFWALSLAPAIDGSIIVPVLSPVLTTLFFLVTGREPASAVRIAGLVPCWAAYSIASKKVLGGMEPLRATTYATGVGALALVLVAVPSIPDTDWTSVSTTAWANVAFLAIGPTAVAYLFYYRGLRSVSPVTATITMFVVPVFGTITSVLFLGESFTAVQIMGALITIAGAVLAVTQGTSRKPHKAPTPATEIEGASP